eukprot:1547157-Pyramimonas_sp.AAC.1
MPCIARVARLLLAPGATRYNSRAFPVVSPLERLHFSRLANLAPLAALPSVPSVAPRRQFRRPLVRAPGLTSDAACTSACGRDGKNPHQPSQKRCPGELRRNGGGGRHIPQKGEDGGGIAVVVGGGGRGGGGGDGIERGRGGREGGEGGRVGYLGDPPEASYGVSWETFGGLLGPSGRPLGPSWGRS